jgi:RNA polymerase-binding transcription factor DksA
VVDERAVEADLENRRRELTRELERLTEPPKAGENLAFGKRIGEGTAEAVERLSTTAAARSIAGTLADIDRALAKIAEGSYGRCDLCGGPIASERLEAMPQAVHCIRCASARGAR